MRKYSNLNRSSNCNSNSNRNSNRNHNRNHNRNRIKPTAARFLALFFTKDAKIRMPATPKPTRKALRLYAAAALAAAILTSVGTTAFAAAATGGSDPVQMVNNLSDFIFGMIRAIGMILVGFGVVQVGMSLKSHDPSQRANGFMTLAGGIIIMLAKEILALIVG